MEECPFVLVPQLTVHPDRMNITTQCYWLNDRRHKNSLKAIMESDHKHHDVVSDQAARKIQKAVQYLLFMASEKKAYSAKNGSFFKFRIAFITLTLASEQRHDDNTIKSKLLNQFLIEAKRLWSVDRYIWRAEKQANGNIHFHILLDKFVPWNELRNTWNRIQNKLGYVDTYRANQIQFYKQGFRPRVELLSKWPIQEQKRAYVQGCQAGWANPNSTDVHSLRFINKIDAYISKYLKKDSQTKGLVGRLWGCSYSLSNLSGAQTDIDSQVSDELDKLRAMKLVREVRKDYFSILFVDIATVIKAGCTYIGSLAIQYFAEKFNFFIQLST